MESWPGRQKRPQTVLTARPPAARKPAFGATRRLGLPAKRMQRERPLKARQQTWGRQVFENLPERAGLETAPVA